MNPRTELAARFAAAFATCDLGHAAPQVAVSRKPTFGDYQVNGLMSAVQPSQRNAREVAATVIAALDGGALVDHCEVAGPGFINIHLSDDWIADQIVAGVARATPVACPRTVVIDYSSPNVAKEMHVGHLRSTIIGDAIARMLEFRGHQVIRQNHIGDWGTQFGMLLAHFASLPQDAGENRLENLEGFYRDARARFDSDPEFAQLARQTVVALQAGDADHLNRWQQFVAISLDHCQRIYERLGVTLQRQDVRGESAYNDDLDAVVADLDHQRLLTRSDGAQCVFLDEFRGKNDAPVPMIVRKSDGGYLYSTTDLAAMRYRCGKLGADRILYVVDARQSLHLQQLFAVSRRAGYAPPPCELQHLAFGTMQGADGTPFRTRDGNLVKLNDLLDEATERALALVTAKNPDLPEAQCRTIAAAIGIGALKYADLSRNRTNDYIFDWDEMLALEGNTAPYLQYANTRIASIFRRAELDPGNFQAPVQISHPAERALALRLLRFDEVLDTAIHDGAPHGLCNWLYGVATSYMAFYEHCPILTAPGPAERASRLMLSRRTGEALRQGLQLLGILPVERM